MVEVSTHSPKLFNAAETQQETKELLFFDEVTNDVALLRFSLEDVFDRSCWETHELPAVLIPQKKRA